MTKILIPYYYSSYGHIETMARAVADISEVKGGSPYGAGAIAGADGSRQPTEKELRIARFQGWHVASIAKKALRLSGMLSNNCLGNRRLLILQLL